MICICGKVRRGPNFYLFSGSWVGYSDTRVFLSQDPTNFGSVPLGTATQVGEIPSHAPEVVRDTDGNWYITRCGWGQGGLYLSPIQWLDGLGDQDTSMPIPSSPAPIPSVFETNLAGWLVPNSTGDVWIATPNGVHGHDPLDNSFLVATQPYVQAPKHLIFEADITLTTFDGNPTSSPSTWTRVGSAAALMFYCANPQDPLARSYVVNIFTDSGGGVKIFKFPYEPLATYSTPISQGVTYHLKLEIQNASQFSVYFSQSGQPEQLLLKASDTTYSSGVFGLNVWQSAATFQNVFVTTT